jgi:hypothetical protein
MIVECTEDKDGLLRRVQLITELRYRRCRVHANDLKEMSEGYV